MRGNLILLLALLSLVGGCRGFPKPSAVPAKYQMRAGQLLFHSDFTLAEDHRLVRELVAERDDISRLLGLPTSDETIDVYLFRDAESYGEYLARHFPGVPPRRAFFLATDTRLAVYAHWSDRVAEDLRHEVAHGYLHTMVPGLPLWLDEGLAEFFEVPRGQFGLNRPHLELLADLMEYNDWRPDLRKLERLTDAAQLEQHHYAEAWAWVYFLLHSDPERRELLTGYLAELRQRGSVEPLSARLATRHIEPERRLAEYLVGLEHETEVARHRRAPLR